MRDFLTSDAFLWVSLAGAAVLTIVAVVWWNLHWTPRGISARGQAAAQPTAPAGQQPPSKWKWMAPAIRYTIGGIGILLVGWGLWTVFTDPPTMGGVGGLVRKHWLVVLLVLAGLYGYGFATTKLPAPATAPGAVPSRWRVVGLAAMPVSVVLAILLGVSALWSWWGGPNDRSTVIWAADGESFVVTVAPSDKSPRIGTRPGWAINYPQVGPYEVHCVYRDGSDTTACASGPMAYQYVQNLSGSELKVAGRYVRPF